jgi:hypothetical protein
MSKIRFKKVIFIFSIIIGLNCLTSCSYHSAITKRKYESGFYSDFSFFSGKQYSPESQLLISGKSGKKNAAQKFPKLQLK